MTYPLYQTDIPYITTEQMREVDRAMIEDYGIDLIQMMENAGRNLAHLARDRFLGGNPTGKKIVVLAGKGGNGGGALVCARRLHNYGADVRVFVIADKADFTPIPQHQFDILDCRVRKLELPKGHSREELQKFQFAFAKLMEDYQVSRVCIKERQPKGKFAGGAVSFKLEAAIQLIDELEVDLISSAQIKESLSHRPLPIPFANTGLKGFQETAFTTAFASISKKQ